MGNDFGKGANRMAIAAMANVVNLDRNELMQLQRQFNDIAQREGNPNTITRLEFQEALELVGISESDRAILDRLFTMCDRAGDNQVNYREFVVGIAPLINGDLASKLQFSFTLYDMDGTGQILPQEMIFVLSSMNNTASYFGDQSMTTQEVEQLVEDIFREADVSQTGTLSYEEYMHAVTAHPLLVQFITKNGATA